jgi:hypothetical protein
LLTGLFLFVLNMQRQKLIANEQIINALTDSVETFKNAHNQNVAKISILETGKVKDFLKIKSQDKEIIKLQADVKANKKRLGNNGSVTNFDSTTDINISVPTGSTASKDTLIAKGTLGTPDTLKIYPEYKSSINLGKWVVAKIIANKDSTSLTQTIENEYTLVLGREPVKRTGFLGFGKDYKSFAEVTNLNPYSKTSTIRSYRVVDNVKVKRVSLGVQVGYSPLTKQPYVGAGLQYNIVNLF